MKKGDKSVPNMKIKGFPQNTGNTSVAAAGYSTLQNFEPAITNMNLDPKDSAYHSAEEEVQNIDSTF